MHLYFNVTSIQKIRNCKNQDYVPRKHPTKTPTTISQWCKAKNGAHQPMILWKDQNKIRIESQYQSEAWDWITYTSILLTTLIFEKWVDNRLTYNTTAKIISANHWQIQKYKDENLTRRTHKFTTLKNSNVEYTMFV